MFKHCIRRNITGAAALLAGVLTVPLASAHDAGWLAPAAVTISYGARDRQRHTRHEDNCSDRYTGHRYQRRHGHDHRHRSRHGYRDALYHSHHDRYRDRRPRGEAMVIFKYLY